MTRKYDCYYVVNEGEDNISLPLSPSELISIYNDDFDTESIVKQCAEHYKSTGYWSHGYESFFQMYIDDRLFVEFIALHRDFVDGVIITDVDDC